MMQVERVEQKPTLLATCEIAEHAGNEKQMLPDLLGV